MTSFFSAMIICTVELIILLVVFLKFDRKEDFKVSTVLQALTE